MCGHNRSYQTDVQHDPRQRTWAHAGSANHQPQVATRPCPTCSTPVQEDFVFCPSCGTELLIACPECHRAVEAKWTHCAFCGTDLAAALN